jgi:hypothetical protein
MGEHGGLWQLPQLSVKSGNTRALHRLSQPDWIAGRSEMLGLLRSPQPDLAGTPQGRRPAAQAKIQDMHPPTERASESGNAVL